MQSYLDMASGTKAAQVSSVKTSVPGKMLVTLILYDKDGHQTFDDTFLVEGDELNVQGDEIIYASWLNVLGLHSGYKITGWQGQYAESQYDQAAAHSVTPMNGGDDNLFTFVQEHTWLSPLAEAIHDKGVVVPLDGKTHAVFLFPSGLVASV
jgi:hypothetical protein